MPEDIRRSHRITVTVIVSIFILFFIGFYIFASYFIRLAIPTPSTDRKAVGIAQDVYHGWHDYLSNNWQEILSDKEKAAISISELVDNGYVQEISKDITVLILHEPEYQISVLSYHHNGTKGYMVNSKGETTELLKADAVAMAGVNTEQKRSNLDN
jgi:hypothetical protein